MPLANGRLLRRIDSAIDHLNVLFNYSYDDAHVTKLEALLREAAQ